MSTTSLIYDSGHGTAPLRTVVLAVQRIDLGSGSFDVSTIGVPNTFAIVGTYFAAHISTSGNLLACYGNSTVNGFTLTTTTTGTVITIAAVSPAANTTVTVVLQLLRNPVT
jgi:hypothetical protein